MRRPHIPAHISIALRCEAARLRSEGALTPDALALAAIADAIENILEGETEAACQALRESACFAAYTQTQET